MEFINVLFNPILPVFAIMAFGYGMGRAGKTSFEDARLINKFAMSVLLPILLFDLVANAPIHSFDPGSVAIYTAAEIVVFTASFLLARRVFKRDPSESVLLAFCAIFSNNAFYVLPISIRLYGETNVLPITSIITLDSTLSFAGVFIFLQLIRLGRANPQTVFVSLIKVPALAAIVLGLAFSLMRLPIPTSFQTFLDFNGAAAAPVALFALGVVLAKTPMKLDVTIASYSAIKMLVFPAVVWFALLALTPLNPTNSLFLFGAAGPAGAMGFSLALLYNVRTDAIAQIMLTTSVLTLISLAILA